MCSQKSLFVTQQTKTNAWRDVFPSSIGFTDASWNPSEPAEVDATEARYRVFTRSSSRCRHCLQDPGPSDRTDPHLHPIRLLLFLIPERRRCHAGRISEGPRKCAVVVEAAGDCDLSNGFVRVSQHSRSGGNSNPGDQLSRCQSKNSLRESCELLWSQVRLLSKRGGCDSIGERSFKIIQHPREAFRNFCCLHRYTDIT